MTIAFVFPVWLINDIHFLYQDLSVFLLLIRFHLFFNVMANKHLNPNKEIKNKEANEI